jgi:hypothetical protein
LQASTTHCSAVTPAPSLVPISLTARLTTDVSICAISTPSGIVSKISVEPCARRKRAGASIIAMPASAVALYAVK